MVDNVYIVHIFFNVPDHSKIQEMCNKAVNKGPKMLEVVPDTVRLKRCLKMLLKSFCFQ